MPSRRHCELQDNTCVAVHGMYTCGWPMTAHSKAELCPAWSPHSPGPVPDVSPPAHHWLPGTSQCHRCSHHTTRHSSCAKAQPAPGTPRMSLVSHLQDASLPRGHIPTPCAGTEHVHRKSGDPPGGTGHVPSHEDRAGEPLAGSYNSRRWEAPLAEGNSMDENLFLAIHGDMN